MLWTAALLAAPVLLASLAVGLVIGLFQAATSVNEQTLTFVPQARRGRHRARRVRRFDDDPARRLHARDLRRDRPDRAMIALDFGFGALEQDFWRVLFLMTRIGAAMLAAPIFGAVAVPVAVRVCAAGAVAVFVAAWMPAITAPAALFTLAGVLAVLGEVLVGLTLGFVLQIAFAAPTIAAELIGGGMGMSIAATADPANGGQTAVFGQFFTIFLILIFLALGAHLYWIRLVVESYQAFPPGHTWLGADRFAVVAGVRGDDVHDRGADRAAGDAGAAAGAGADRGAEPLGAVAQPVCARAARGRARRVDRADPRRAGDLRPALRRRRDVARASRAGRAAMSESAGEKSFRADRRSAAATPRAKATCCARASCRPPR
jgi:flagellar biosynthesis protein FliR